ncbi:unnamed protein product, partial [marine sediment metagenome]
ADGRLLVQEERFVTEAYTSGTGTPIRIGLVNTVEKVLALDTYVSGYPEAKVAAPLADAKVSGDVVLVGLRRADVTISAGMASNLFAFGALAHITSGKGWMEELTSGLSQISGKLKILVNVRVAFPFRRSSESLINSIACTYDIGSYRSKVVGCVWG